MTCKPLEDLPAWQTAAKSGAHAAAGLEQRGCKATRDSTRNPRDKAGPVVLPEVGRVGLPRPLRNRAATY